MSGRDFNRRLHRLEFVYLHNNECIDEDFNNRNEIDTIIEVVEQECGFRKSTEDSRHEKCEDLYSKISNLETTILRLEAEFKASNNAKAKNERQNDDY